MKALSDRETAKAGDAPQIVHDVLHSPGQPLDVGTRAFMEPRFGHDFGQVRVHADTKAADSARAVNALAYTVGRDVVFGAGQYAPGTSEGRKLLGHELAHSVQQDGGSRSAVVQRFTDFNFGALPEGWEGGSITTGPRRTVPLSVSSTPTVPGVCGPDVTSQTVDAINKTKSRFQSTWSDDERTDACHSLTSWFTGSRAWDINELHNNAWILGYRPDCATQGAYPRCGSSVQVHDGCHYAGSVNYVIFGVMCDLCRGHFLSLGDSDADDYSESEMLDLIDLYKGTGWTGLATPSANLAESQRWASAGYHDWPSCADPAGDRSTCTPTCPTAYNGPAFTVHWIPMGWF